MRAGACAISTSWSYPAGGTVSTTRWPARTAPTSCAPSCASGLPVALARLPVARLRLAGRPGAHQPAGALPGLQPVAEVGARDVLEFPDVVLEVGQHGLALRPGQRLALARVLLQEALKRPGESGAG